MTEYSEKIERLKATFEKDSKSQLQSCQLEVDFWTSFNVTQKEVEKAINNAIKDLEEESLQDILEEKRSEG